MTNDISDTTRLDWLDLPGHGVARHRDYAAAGDHREATFFAVQGETARAAIDAAILSERAALARTIRHSGPLDETKEPAG